MMPRFSMPYRQQPGQQGATPQPGAAPGAPQFRGARQYVQPQIGVNGYGIASQPTPSQPPAQQGASDPGAVYVGHGGGDNPQADGAQQWQMPSSPPVMAHMGGGDNPQQQSQAAQGQYAGQSQAAASANNQAQAANQTAGQAAPRGTPNQDPNAQQPKPTGIAQTRPSGY